MTSNDSLRKLATLVQGNLNIDKTYLTLTNFMFIVRNASQFVSINSFKTIIYKV